MSSEQISGEGRSLSTVDADPLAANCHQKSVLQHCRVFTDVLLHLLIMHLFFSSSCLLAHFWHHLTNLFMAAVRHACVHCVDLSKCTYADIKQLRQWPLIAKSLPTLLVIDTEKASGLQPHANGMCMRDDCDRTPASTTTYNAVLSLPSGYNTCTVHCSLCSHQLSILLPPTAMH